MRIVESVCRPPMSFGRVASRISAARLAKRIGEAFTVLVDGHEREAAIARSAADAPEIDGTVRIADGRRLAAGSFTRVRASAAAEHDLDAVAA